MKNYPGTWGGPGNPPFNLLAIPIIAAVIADGGSIPTALSSIGLARLIDEDNAQQLRVKDYGAAIDGTVTERNSIDVRLDLGARALLYGASVHFRKGFDDQSPQFFHLMETQDCLFKQSTTEPFDHVSLLAGYSDWIYTKPDANPVYTGSGVNNCAGLNLGMQVGSTENVNGSLLLQRRPVQGIGIMASGVDNLTNWDLWGSNDNNYWTPITKAMLNGNGWKSGEMYLSSFRGAGGYPTRLCMFSKPERYQHYKATIHEPMKAATIYKVFPFNLTGEMGFSIDGQSYEYGIGDWLNVGTGDIVLPQVGAYAGQFGEYGGTPGAPAIDQYLQVPGFIGVHTPTGVLFACDAVMKCIKVFDLATQLCTGYITAPTHPTTFYSTIRIVGDYILAGYLDGSNYVNDKINVTSPYTVVSSTTISGMHGGVGSILDIEADDAYFYVLRLTTGPNKVWITKILQDLSGTYVDEVSKALTVSTPVFPTFRMRLAGNYIYGVDSFANVMCSINTNDLTTEKSVASWFEGATEYSFDYANARPIINGIDEQYIYLNVFVSDTVPNKHGDLLKIKVDDFSFIDRIPFDATNGIWTTGLATGTCDSTYVYIGNSSSSDSKAYISYFYKNNVIVSQDKHCVFLREKLGDTDYAPIPVSVDVPVTVTPFGSCLTDTADGPETNSLLPWSDVTGESQIASIPCPDDSGQFSLIHNDGWIKSPLPQQIPAGAVIIIKVSEKAVKSEFASLGGYLTFRANSDSGPDMASFPFGSAEWTRHVSNSVILTENVTEVFLHIGIPDGKSFGMIDAISISYQYPLPPAPVDPSAFRAFKYLRYRLDPFSNDKRCATEIYEINAWNDPRYIQSMPAPGLRVDMERTVFPIKDGGAGTISKADQPFWMRVDQGRINAKVNDLQVFSIKDAHTAAHAAPSATSGFYLTDTTRRITECKFILNADSDYLGSPGDTSVVVTDGGTALVNEVEIGGLTAPGDYCINYQTGYVDFFSGATGAACSIAFAYADEGAVGLEYRCTQTQTYKRFGIPAGAPATAVLAPEYDQSPEILHLKAYVRSNLGLFAEELARHAYLLLYLSGEFTDLSGMAKPFVMLDYIRWSNARLVVYPGIVLMKEMAMATACNFCPMKESIGAVNAGAIDVRGPVHVISANYATVREAANVCHAGICLIREIVSLTGANFVVVRNQADSVNANIIPVVTPPTNREVVGKYDFDPVANWPIAVRGRKAGG